MYLNMFQTFVRKHKNVVVTGTLTFPYCFTKPIKGLSNKAKAKAPRHSA